MCRSRGPVRISVVYMTSSDFTDTSSHCPWAANCVGVNNHREFILYMLSLTLSIIIIISLYLYSLEKRYSSTTPPHCTLLSDSLCAEFSKDPFSGVLMIWSALQLTWSSMLLLVQLAQVARALTTHEAMRGHRHVGPVTAALTTGSLETQPSAGAAAAPISTPQKRETGCWPTWKRLLGLDTIVAAARREGRHHPSGSGSRPTNPYDVGVVRNCRDFWLDGPLIGTSITRKPDATGVLAGEKVDYARLYSVPEGVMRYRRGGYESVSTAEDAV